MKCGGIVKKRGLSIHEYVVATIGCSRGRCLAAMRVSFILPRYRGGGK
jgi:hypothetical protein